MLERIFPNHWGGARWLLEILLVCFPFPFPPSRRQTWRRTNPKTIMLLECSTRSIKTKKAKQTRSQANANIFNEPTETNKPTSSSCYPVMTQNQSNNNLTTTGLEWMTIGQWMDFFGQGTISWWQLILFGGSTHFPWKRNEIVLAHGFCFWRWDAKDRPKDSSLPNEDERTKKGNERKKDNKRIVSKPILLLGHFLLQRKNTSLFWPLGLFSLELENSNVPTSGSYL